VTARLAAAVLSVSTLLTGCMVGPNYKTPVVKDILPDEDRFAETYTPSTLPTTLATTQNTGEPSTQPVGYVDLAKWWESFHDPELTSLEQRAAVNNYQVKDAVAMIREARATWGESVAGLFPQVNAGGSYSHERGSKNAGGLVSGSGGSTTGGSASTGGTGSSSSSTSGAAGGASVHDLYQVGFDATWELDIFGGQRRSIEAADYDIQAQIENKRNTLVTVLAEVANDYVTLRGAQHELQITYNNLKSQQDVLDLIRSQFKAGLTNELTVAQQEATVETTAAQVPQLQQTIRQSIYSLGVLLGVPPESLLPELLGTLPPLSGPPNVPPGLPSSLLRRRPDVRQAERLLAASTANIGVAVSELFPQFSITGSAGLESSKTKNLFDWGSRYYSIGPSVSWPILDFGRLRANVDVQNARQEEALDSYKNTVLQSLTDVENGLVAYSREQVRQAALTRAVASDQRAVDLATELYQKGLTDFLNVLTTEQTLFAAEDSQIVSQTQVATNLVSLYKALGGGWEIGEEKDKNKDASQQQAQSTPADNSGTVTQ
jgi:NodT family efflux transporter outer membrane factor (OMF) lipoprotein